MNRTCWITVITILCLALAAPTTVFALALVSPTLSRCRSPIACRPQYQQQQRQWSQCPGSFVSLNMDSHDNHDHGIHRSKSSVKNIFLSIWKRMDTLETAGLKDEFAEYPVLVSRGGGFKRFMIIMALGMAYKWYRARFINKVRRFTHANTQSTFSCTIMRINCVP